MSIYLMIFIVIVAIAAIMLIIEPRNFFLGSIVMSAGILAIFYFYIKFLNFFLQRGHIITFLIIIFGTLIVFIALIRALVINTHIVEHKEGRSFTAKLSLVFGSSLVLILALMFIVIHFNVPHFGVFIITLIVFLYLTFLILFMSYLLYSFIYQMIPKRRKIDYIIVLGCYAPNGEVSPLLKIRVDKAVQYYRKQNGKLKFVVSGRKGADETTSEAEAMKKYLLSIGIPASQIIVEGKSLNTLQNMLFSKKLIYEDWEKRDEPGESTILFSTSNYHVFRGSLYARKAHLDAQGIGAPTSFYFLPTALIREFIAILVHYKIFTLAIIISEVLFFWAIFYLH